MVFSQLNLFRHVVAASMTFILLTGQSQNIDARNQLKDLEPKTRTKPDSSLKVLLTISVADQSSKAMLAFLKGQCYSQLSRIDSAEFYLSEAKKQVAGDNHLRAKILFVMGENAYSATKYRYSADLLLKADSLTLQSPDTELKRMIKNGTGSAFLALNKPDSALPFFNEALTLAEANHDTLSVARVLNNLSITYYKLGNIEKAIEWQIKAVAIKEKIGDTVSIATSLNNIGSYFIKLDYFDDAKRYLLRSFTMISERQSGKIKAYAASNLGISYKMLQVYDSSEYYYNEALAYYKKMGIKSSIGKSYSNLGGLYESQLKYDKALEYMMLARKMSKEIGMTFETIIPNRNIANLYLLMGSPEKAYPYLMEALEAIKAVKSTEMEMEVYKTMSNYYEQTGDAKKALYYFKSFKEAADTLFQQRSIQHINELNVIYETEKKEKNIRHLLDQQRINELTIRQKENELLTQRLILAFTVLAILLVLMFLYFWYSRQKIKTRIEKETLARQKSDLEQRLLLSQMNPHFIFNSLGSVQHFIGLNEGQKAQLFLSRFAKLMRAILENSRRQFIPLEEEIESLKIYLELEKQRFGDRFDFGLQNKIDESEFFMIPPMMLQPFAENAILHGFTQPDKKGFINIELAIENDLFRCTFTDNGEGRNAKHNTPSTNNHHSVGTTVVMDRIALFRKEFSCEASLEYEDLYTSDGTAAGTKVTISLPFKERED